MQLDDPLIFLAQGAVIITPNNRLSNELIHRYFHANSNPLQEKPKCFSYQDFLRKLYQTHCHNTPKSPLPLLLTNNQCTHLWQKIIASSDNAPINQSLINEIQEAWNRCQRWSIDPSDPSFAYTAQTRQFQQWAHQYHTFLQKKHFITEDQLVDFFLSQPNLTLPKTIVWHCFDDYTPQQQLFQHYLINQGCDIFFTDVKKENSNTLLYEATDADDENTQLINWIKEQQSQGEKKIGVVIPDLHSQGSQLERLFKRHLTSIPFNISLGKALNQFPLIRHALSWLRLSTQTLSNHEARLLLHSPYILSSATEMLTRAQYMQDSTAINEMTIQSSFFIAELEPYSPKLAEALKKLTPYPKKTSVHEWIIEFSNRLTQLGFPGEYSLNSITYQTHHRFQRLFEEFKECYLITPEMTEEQALITLESLAKSAIFQPKTTPATVQILGLLESSGCLFDALWITNMTDECLPQKVKLSAFIPVNLQRDYSMPHSNAERELGLAITILERLKHSSPSCIISYPKLTLDKPNSPSPLVKGLPLFKQTTQQATNACLALETYHEHYELPLLLNEKITGGTALLANQAKCPFRAFAAHRLHAKKESLASEGLNAMERGQVIHKIMELIWQQLQSQKTLLSLPSNDLDNIIQKAIETALLPFQLSRPHSFSTLFQQVEKNRLKQLVEACLYWETQRPPFTISALEQTHTLDLAGVSINVRIDRLDKLATGKQWVIDYKTAIPTSMPWREERPKEPQLLLYALLDETINTLLFTGLKEGRLSCKGLSEEHSDLIGLTAIKEDETWSELRAYWRTQLNELAKEFSLGYHSPQPINPSICQQCDFQRLCRFEQSL